MNILGNRHLRNNLRVIVINNGTGYEMHTSNSIGKQFSDQVADMYFAAGGHNGNQSRNILKHFSEDLGFEYIPIESKEDYLNNVEYITSSQKHDKALLVEVFVSMQNDNFSYDVTKKTVISSQTAIKDMARSILGEDKIRGIKRIIGK